MQAWKNCGKALLQHFTCEGKQSGHHSIYILVSGRESLIAHQPLTGQNARLMYFLLSLPYKMDISQLANLRRAYHELERCVQCALNTQVGDSERLAEAQGEVLSYIQAVEQVC